MGGLYEPWDAPVEYKGIIGHPSKRFYRNPFEKLPVVSENLATVRLASAVHSVISSTSPSVNPQGHTPQNLKP